MVENVGYRQLILWARVQGIIKFLAGSHRWEKVIHKGESLASDEKDFTPAHTEVSIGRAA